MDEKSSAILTKAEVYIRHWYQREIPNAFVFHNFHHTQSIVNAVQRLAKREKLPPVQVEAISLAAWFQYAGLAIGEDNFCEHSAQIAEVFLREEKYDQELREQVIALIRNRDRPVSLSEQIFYDATHLYLAEKDFFTMTKLLRVEREELSGESFTEKAWAEYLLNLLLHHNYYTPWVQKKYGRRKLDHLASQKKKGLKAREKTLKKKTGKYIGRGVDTLYRTGFRNHINLSQIADGKANMMISINTIVLSILIAVSGAGLSFVDRFFLKDFYYILPVIILIVSSLIALIFAVFSAKPTITANKLQKVSSLPPDVSMLYFGNFLQMEKEDFVEYLDRLKTDQNRLYDDLARDLYNLGLVLQKKYRLLSISYNIFVGGLVFSVVAFLIVYLL